MNHAESVQFFKDTITAMDPDVQAQIDIAAARIRQLVALYGSAGLVALALVGLENSAD